MKKLLSGLVFFMGTLLFMHSSCASRQTKNEQKAEVTEIPAATSEIAAIQTGAEQIEEYLPLLKGKNVGLVVNQTSMVGKTHLADTLLALGIKIKKIFSPEHGFRGNVDAGEKVSSGVDAKTGISIVSLYGNNKKPSKESLQDLDMLIFDIQDVGVRFYTYISTMHYIMEACAENNKELIILDRPNPNGFYIDGPVLEKKFKSFVGMHPIPIVHGLTVGELAKMINGEKWLDSAKVCKLAVIKNKNYSHKDSYSLPVKPSPNLPNDFTIRLYPSLGLFEGIEMSVGKSTELPFQIIVSPNKNNGSFTFVPKRIPGMLKPLYENEICYGIDLRKEKHKPGFTIKYVIDFYNKAENKEKYFKDFFNTLAGNSTLQEQIKKGMTEEAIKKTWEEDLKKYKEIRKKYLLYE